MAYVEEARRLLRSEKISGTSIQQFILVKNDS